MSVTLAAPLQVSRRPSIGFAFGWYYWRLNRGLMAGIVINCAIAKLVAIAMHADNLLAVGPMGALLIVWSVMSIIFMIGKFAGSSFDIALADEDSGYPANLRTLPVRTSELALWPMIYALISVTAMAALVNLTLGGKSAAPVCMFSVAAIFVQVWNWTPLKLWAALPILAFLVMGWVVGSVLLGLSDGVLTVCYMALVAGMVLIGIRAVARARCGDAGRPTSLDLARNFLVIHRNGEAPSFPSADSAQTWFEWYGHGWALPQLSLFLTALYVCILYLVPHSVRSLSPAIIPPQSGLGSITVYSIGTSIAPIIIILMPLVCAAIVGGGAQKHDSRKKSLALNSLFATRPLTSFALVAAKLRMMVRSTLATWILMMPLALLWAISPASDHGITGMIGVLVLRYVHLNNLAGIVATVILILYTTWKFQTDGLYFELIGSRWAVWLSQVPAVLVGWLSLHLILTVISDPVEYHRSVELIKAGILIAATVKLIATGVLAWIAVTRGACSGAELRSVTGLWAALAVVIAACGFAIAGAIGMKASLAAATVILFLPGIRFVLAPLALHWNRHR